MKEEIKFDELSKHLFWDIDKNSLKSQKNKKQIIQRVLEYGFVCDWKIIKDYYGVKDIAETATKIRSLDKKSAAFISTISGIRKEEFLCYTMRQLIPNHWDF